MTRNEIIARALSNTGIEVLNEMQQAVLDAGTTKDMVLLSPTGSGKTLAFLLPLLTTLTDEDKKIQALIIAPSRELALQIETVFRSLGAGYKVNCCYGGHPIRTEKKSLELFLDISKTTLPEGAAGEGPERYKELGLTVIVPSFILSELNKAFTMGFLLFIPFLIVDLVVSSTLMSMGMVMLPPTMIALPFKIMLFVLVDGWDLVIKTLVQGFR